MRVTLQNHVSGLFGGRQTTSLMESVDKAKPSPDDRPTYSDAKMQRIPRPRDEDVAEDDDLEEWQRKLMDAVCALKDEKVGREILELLATGGAAESRIWARRVSGATDLQESQRRGKAVADFLHGRADPAKVKALAAWLKSSDAAVFRTTKPQRIVYRRYH